MKIIFFGTPEFAVPSLKILKETPNIEILAVVTQPDKKVGRKREITQSAVKIAAKDLGLKILQPKNKEELEKLLKSDLKETIPDFFVVIAFGMLFTEKILKIPKYGAINVHASLLPKYRGASPIQESLINGDKETGISIMKMDEKLDHGSIFLIKRIKIENDDLTSLTNKLSILSGQILPLILTDIIEKKLTPLSQSDKNITNCKKIKKEDGNISWDKTAEEINNMIKAYTPWPSVYTNFNGKKIKILKSEYEKTNIKNNQPGTFFMENKTLKIATKKGNLLPEILQIEGKKEMDMKSFINGYKNLIK